MKYFNIQTVSEMCNLSTHCIRAWEKRYGAIKPQRASNGRRLYTEAEMDRLMMLGKLSNLGNSISLIANLPDEELRALLDKLSKGKTIPHVREKSLLSPESYFNNLLMALQAYKLDILTHELNKASMDLSPRDFALEVVAKLFHRVGELVHQGRMGIAQEHTLSAITKFSIGQNIARHYEMGIEGRPRIVLATPPGELHSIGLLLGALLMTHYRVNFIYLGEDLPEVAIAEAVKATDSDVVLLSVSPFYKNTGRNINEVTMNLRKHLSPKTELWVGGSIRDLQPATIRMADVTTFSDLDQLERKLVQIVES